ncbi:MAG: HAD family phosphatase [Candidatus Nomurabacteria bacterium]|nr:HAD family phosphatase [Candidatus Nomurabacteria bacterium]
MIKALVFDVGGVLHSYDSDKRKAYLAGSLGVDINVMQKFWKDQELRLFELGKISEKQLWQQAHDRYGTRMVGDDEDLFGKSFEKVIKVDNEMTSLVKSLRGGRYKLAVLSNTCGPDAKVNAPILSLFDQAFLSCRIGYKKPAREVYEYAFGKLGVQPDEAVMIDDRDDNVAGAKYIGMQAIKFEGVDRLCQELAKLGVKW